MHPFRDMARWTVPLRQARLSAGLSPEDVGQAVGVSGRVILNWEEHLTCPHARELALWAIALGWRLTVTERDGCAPFCACTPASGCMHRDRPGPARAMPIGQASSPDAEAACWEKATGWRMLRRRGRRPVLAR